MKGKREKNGLSPLAVHVVAMVPGDSNNSDGDAKLSSTSLRREKLGTLLKPPLVDSFVRVTLRLNPECLETGGSD